MELDSDAEPLTGSEAEAAPAEDRLLPPEGKPAEAAPRAVDPAQQTGDHVPPVCYLCVVCFDLRLCTEPTAPHTGAVGAHGQK